MYIYSNTLVTSFRLVCIFSYVSLFSAMQLYHVELHTQGHFLLFDMFACLLEFVDIIYSRRMVKNKGEQNKFRYSITVIKETTYLVSLNHFSFYTS